MNLTAARDALRARGFDGLTDDRCDVMLNAGKNTLDDFAPWPWLQTSTTNVAPLTITDLKAVTYVWNTTTKTTLRGSDKGFLRDNYGPDLTVASTASFWYLDGLTTLRVFPADTSSSFSVDYLMVSPELSADSDEPLSPARLHPIWIDLACVEAYEDADEPGMAQALQAKAEARLWAVVDVYFGRNLQNAQEQGVFNAVDG